MYRLIFFIFLVMSMIGASSQSLHEGDSLYQKKEYTNALKVYQQVSQEKGISAALLYNMGNAAVQSDRYGDAMIYYQRAIVLEPGNFDIRHNIAYLKEKIDGRNSSLLGNRKGDVVHGQPTLLQQIRIAVISNVSPTFWGSISLIAFVIMLVGLSVYLMSTSVRLRKISFFTSLSSLLIVIATALFTVSARNHWAHRNQCVITAFQATPLPTPSETAKPSLTPLVAGTLLSTPEPPDSVPQGWIYVRLNETTAGWLPETDVTKL